MSDAVLTDGASGPNGQDPPSRTPTRLPRKPRPAPFSIGVVIIFIVMTIVTWRATGFTLGGIVSNLTRDNAAMEAVTSPDFGQIWSDNSRQAFIETLRLAIIGTVTGSAVALPVALWSSRIGNPDLASRVVLRSFNNIIRAIPELLWALLFVAAVGISGGGALAGVLALFFFSLAVTTKLTYDTLDGIDMGPVEAAHASGATYTQMLRTAVIPQILPSYTSFVLYNFELNLRASAVLGLVGAGGIGERIEYFRNASPANWEAVWGIVFMFFLVVFVVERFSVTLRRRLI